MDRRVLMVRRPDENRAAFSFCGQMNDISNSGTQRVNVLPIVDTMPADLLTPLSVYLKLAEGAKFSFLLESVAGGENLARYSFVGSDPHAVVSGGNRSTTVSEASRTDTLPQPLFQYLKDHFATFGIQPDRNLPAFIGGAIGYLAFPCVNWFEPGLYESGNETGAEFMIFRTIVAFDHARQEV